MSGFFLLEDAKNWSATSNHGIKVITIFINIRENKTLVYAVRPKCGYICDYKTSTVLYYYVNELGYYCYKIYL